MNDPTAAPSQRQLARELERAPSLITKYKAQGMPVHSAEAARAWMDKHIGVNFRKREEPATRFEEPGGIVVPPVPPRHSRWQGSDSDESFDEARRRTEVAKADLLELELAMKAETVVEAAKVRAEFARQISAVREAILQLPARLAPVVVAQAALSDVQQLLEVELRQALDQFAAAA